VTGSVYFYAAHSTLPDGDDSIASLLSRNITQRPRIEVDYSLLLPKERLMGMSEDDNPRSPSRKNVGILRHNPVRRGEIMNKKKANSLYVGFERVW